MVRYLIIFWLFYIQVGANNDKSIIIVGAGLSGYAAARKLIYHGYENIIILEAQGRVGGRVHSVAFSKGFVDMGAQWIHGQKGNIIYELTAEDNTVSLGSTPFETVNPYFIFSNGTFPTQESFIKVYNAGSKAADLADKTANVQKQTYRDVFNRQFDKKVSKINASPEVVSLVKEEVRKDRVGYFGVKDLNEVSAKVNYEEELAKGDQHITWGTAGFKSFLDILSKDRNIESKISMNKTVTQVYYNTTDVNAKVYVVCSDKTSYQADHVIFTPSLGYLKKNHKSIFYPALPEKKVLAIESRGYGSVGKIFMEFDRAFWKISDSPFVAIQGMWLEQEKLDLKKTGRDWLLGIAGVYAVDGFENTLEFFITGEYVLAFEQTTAEKVAQDLSWWVGKFLPTVKPTPVLKNIKVTNWLTNQYFLGSYSFPSTLEESNNVGTKDLAHSIQNKNQRPIVLFAGEATDPKYPSTAHGAVRSGFRAATEIIGPKKSANGVNQKKNIRKTLLSLDFTRLFFGGGYYFGGYGGYGGYYGFPSFFFG